jgi:hypothetical protein
MVESTFQLGGGNFGLVPSLCLTYEIVPHRINTLALTSCRHTFMNNDGYQFDDEMNLSGGSISFHSSKLRGWL